MEDRSVLGAMSGLAKGQTIPENEIWVGTPAKFLRRRGEKLDDNPLQAS